MENFNQGNAFNFCSNFNCFKGNKCICPCCLLEITVFIESGAGIGLFGKGFQDNGLLSGQRRDFSDLLG